MREKVLKISAIFSLILMFVACGSVFFLPQFHDISLALDMGRLKKSLSADIREERGGVSIINTDEEMIDFPQQLRVELPDGCDAKEVKIKQNYLTQTVDLVIPTDNADFLYGTPLVGNSKNISNVVMDYTGGNATIEIVLDQVLETEETRSGKYLYLDFLSPHDLYEKVIVVDAGHGGNAPGAAKQGIYEKDINLAIVQELKTLLDHHKNFRVYYTRLDDSNPAFGDRVGLANKSDADLFISIHNNSMSGSKYSKITGTQVMYDELKDDSQSKNLAQICLEEVTASCKSVDKGLVKGNDIYIIRTAEVPVALVEVGFLTNPQELAKLNSKDYQQQAAQGVYQAILRAFDEGY